MTFTKETAIKLFRFTTNDPHFYGALLASGIKTIETDPMDEKPPSEEDCKNAVAFLREWADAIDS